MSTPPPPYTTDSERDRQVRARLAELGAARRIPVEEILQQLEKALWAAALDAKVLGNPRPLGILTRAQLRDGGPEGWA